MSYLTSLGLTAGFCTTIAFIPQVMKTWKTRSAKDLSLAMFVVYLAGILLWLLYGVLLGDIAIVLANAATSVLAGSVLYFKLRYG
jgi:MtN3 and saliva related transmembrane protein